MKWTRGSKVKVKLNAPGAAGVKADLGVTGQDLPPGGEQEEEETANEPGSRARSRSKAVTRRRAQWRADHGLPPREEEWAAAAAAAGGEDDDVQEEVEIGQADFSTDLPPRGAGRWRHRGDKSQHVPERPRARSVL